MNHMKPSKEVIEEKVTRGFRILERKEKYDPSRFPGPSEAAEAIFKEALCSDPDCYLALLGLGRCYYYRPTQYSEAISTFQRAITIQPYEAEPYYWIGLTYFHAGERKLPLFGANDVYEEALRYFHKALEMGYEPKAWLYNHIGTVHFREARYEQAITWFQRSADSIKSEGGWVPSTFFLAAEACEYLGRFADAIKWYELYKEYGLQSSHKEVNQRIKKLIILEENRKKAL